MAKQQNPKDKPPKRRNQTTTLLNGWEHFLKDPATYEDRLALGKRMREQCDRAEHGDWRTSRHRLDPLKLLASQDEGRLENLIPLRYQRMAESPFAFYRGAALIMASDLANVPRSTAMVQLCGDCHLSNFGVFATPERNIIFDLNDFDETLPGPFEWDLKRLAASLAVAADSNGFTKSVASRCVRSMTRTYRRKMREYSQSNTLDIWYEKVDFEDLVGKIRAPRRKQTAMESLAKIKQKKTHAGALSKYTEVVDGKRRIKDNPPYVYHPEAVSGDVMKKLLHTYSKSLWESRQRLLERYHFVDMSMRVVGVGSVGTAAGMVLLQGEGSEDDYIFLQIKQAVSSVLERYLGRSQFEHPGQRIVNGQRLLQSASDLFLGWTSGPKRDFYVRQLMDVKASVPVEELDAVTFEQYAETCALVLARAHARTGDPVVISGYLGKSECFDEALDRFALAYAKQNERDYCVLKEALDKGKYKQSQRSDRKRDALSKAKPKK